MSEADNFHRHILDRQNATEMVILWSVTSITRIQIHSFNYYSNNPTNKFPTPFNRSHLTSVAIPTQNHTIACTICTVMIIIHHNYQPHRCESTDVKSRTTDSDWNSEHSTAAEHSAHATTTSMMVHDFRVCFFPALITSSGTPNDVVVVVVI